MQVRLRRHNNTDNSSKRCGLGTKTSNFASVIVATTLIALVALLNWPLSGFSQRPQQAAGGRAGAGGAGASLSANLLSNQLEDLIDGNLNLTQLLFDRFASLFSADQSTQQDKQPSRASAAQLELPQFATKLASSADDYLIAADGFAYNPPSHKQLDSRLDSRREQAAAAAAAANDEDQRRRRVVGLGGDEATLPNFFRVLDRVFSRVRLPELYKQPSHKPRTGYCTSHLGCIDELPNFPSLLKKPNVSASFTIYTSRNPKTGAKIVFEPTMHHQLADLNQTTTTTSTAALDAGAQKQSVSATADLSSQIVSIAAAAVAAVAAASAANSKPYNSQHGRNNHRIRGQQASSSQGSLLATRGSQAANSRQSSSSSSSSSSQSPSQLPWRSLTRVTKSQEYPFDLSALEASGFNASLPTRVIVGGYFAKEDETWIEDLVKHWMLLQPDSNVIKVSWADANRGLYHTAAYNSRIVGRQMTLFLYYLDKLFGINLQKFHLVGHSLGAHIAGFVGADLSAHGNNSKVARITGLDPAGPIFVELNASMRLDPSDAAFVDVIHTNGGPIIKGALGLTAPSGHVDYFPNGNSQPGCYFSSMTKSIMDPVERVACNHRRSYRYFIEIIRLTTNEMSNKALLEEANTEYCRFDLDLGYACEKVNFEKVMQRRLPRAFLFEVKNMDELSKLSQPELLAMSPQASSRKDLSSLAPLKRPIEFHTFKPDFPACCKRGLYYFKTRSEAPFFAAKQHALTLWTEAFVRKKISLTVKLEQSIVAEVDIDEIPGSCTLLFVPQDASLGVVQDADSKKVPQLSLMWKYRSFNLLLNQQSHELHLTSLELSLIDTENEAVIVRYNSSYPAGFQPTTATTTSPPPAVAPQQSLDPNISKTPLVSAAKYGIPRFGLTLNRNQWYRFDGFKLISGAASGSGDKSDFGDEF